MSTLIRIEEDLLGTREVPADATSLYTSPQRLICQGLAG